VRARTRRARAADGAAPLDGEPLHVARGVGEELDDHLAELALRVLVHLERVLVELGEEVGCGHVPEVLVPARHLVDDLRERLEGHRPGRELALRADPSSTYN
jgi:hypothetical protein